MLAPKYFLVIITNMNIPRFKVPTSQSSSLGQTLAHPTLKSSRLPSSRPRNILKSWPLLWQARVRSPRIGAVAGKPIGTLPGENQSAADFASVWDLLTFCRTLQQHVRAERKIQRVTPERKFRNPEIFLPGSFLISCSYCFLFGDVITAHNDWQSKF